MTLLLRYRLPLFLASFALLFFFGCKQAPPVVEQPPVSPRDVADTALEVGREEAVLTPKLSKEFTTEREWDSLQQIVWADTFKSVGKRDPNFRFFGWHPYFFGSAYHTYNFDALWAVAYFGYELDPQTGSYRNIYQWKTTDLVKVAHKKGCKVFLTIVSFGKAQNDTFLRTADKWQRCADSLISLIQYKGADGLNIDFEDVGANRRGEFTAWIRYLSRRIKKHNPKWQVSLCVPAVDWNKVYNFKALNPHIDFYTLMGYDYYYRGSRQAGPTSPLRSGPIWNSYTLETSLKIFKKAGLPFNKLIAGLPYYGAEWKVIPGNKLPLTVVKFMGHKVYRSYRRKLDSLKSVRVLENWSVTRYYNYSHDSADFQVWTDDAYTLSVKFDWARRQKLAGVGIWALGYDNGYSDIWKIVNDKFIIPPKVKQPAAPKRKPAPRRR